MSIPRLTLLKQENGRALVSDPARDAQMVESILTFKKKLHNIVTLSFNSTTSFVNTIKEAFEDFINTRANKPAEMVAKHIDGLLKTSKGVTEEEIEVQLNECLGLFRFIQGQCFHVP